MKKVIVTMIVAGLLMPAVAVANDTEAEIEYLVSTIGASECTFIRNGKRHDAADAEDHLRMKYRRGKRYAPTAERFIERLASASSLSRKPYFIECGGEGAVPAGDWLTARLTEYRQASKAPVTD